MRKTFALILAVSFCLIPALAAAEVTLLAREEMRVGVNDDPKAAAQAIVTKAIEAAKKHPCSVAAGKENRLLDVGIKLSFIPGEDNTYFTVIVEIVAENC